MHGVRLEQDPAIFRAMRQVMCVRGASWIALMHIRAMRPFDCDETSCGFRATRRRDAGARSHGSRMRNASLAALAAPLSRGAGSLRSDSYASRLARACTHSELIRMHARRKRERSYCRFLLAHISTDSSSDPQRAECDSWPR